MTGAKAPAPCTFASAQNTPPSSTSHNHTAPRCSSLLFLGVRIFQIVYDQPTGCQMEETDFFSLVRIHKRPNLKNPDTGFQNQTDG